MHYKSLVPASNKVVRDFALRWWGKQPSAKGYWTDREHTKQWEEFSEETSTMLGNRVQEIIGGYFPTGRPGKEGLSGGNSRRLQGVGS